MHMGRYVIRRLLQMIPVFFGVTFLMYLLMFSLGDPIKSLGAGKQKNPAYEAFLRQEFNLDDPFIVQYLKYLQGIFTGDFGSTFAGKPVSELFWERFPVTLHSRPDGVRHRGRPRHRHRHHRRPAQGRIARQHRPGQHPGGHLDPRLRHRFRGPVRLRSQARVVPTGRHH